MKIFQSYSNNLDSQNNLTQEFVNSQLSEFCTLFCVDNQKLPSKDNTTISDINDSSKDRLSILGTSFMENPFNQDLSKIAPIIVLRQLQNPFYNDHELLLLISCLNKNADEINHLLKQSQEFQPSITTKTSNYPKVISHALYLATFFCDYDAVKTILEELNYFNKKYCPNYENYLNISLYYFGTYFIGNCTEDIQVQDFIIKNMPNYQKISTLLVRKGADLTKPFLGEQSIYLKMIFSIHSEEYLISMLDYIKDVNIANKLITIQYDENGNILCKIEDMPSYLMGAIDTKKISLVEALVKKGANTNFFIQHSEKYLEHILTCAADAGPKYLKCILTFDPKINLDIQNINSHINIHTQIIEKNYSYLDLVKCTKETLRLENLSYSINKLQKTEILLINPLIDILIQHIQYKNKFEEVPSDYNQSLLLTLYNTQRMLTQYLESTIKTILPSLLVCKKNPILYISSSDSEGNNTNIKNISLPDEIWEIIGAYIAQNCISSKSYLDSYKSGNRLFDTYMKSLSSKLNVSSLFAPALKDHKNNIELNDNKYLAKIDYDESLTLIAENSDEDYSL